MDQTLADTDYNKWRLSDFNDVTRTSPQFYEAITRESERVQKSCREIL